MIKPWARTFFFIWAGQAFSLIGSAVAQFTLVWWLTAQTGSASILALASIFGFLPQALCGPFAGVLIDRLNRKALIIGADLLIAAASLGLAGLYATGSVPIWAIYLVLALRSVATAFHGPALNASIPLIVPADQLTRTAGFNQALQSATAILGPALGALLASLWPMAAIMLIDVVGAVIASLILLTVRIPQPPAAPTGERGQGYFAELRESIQALQRAKGIWYLMLAQAVFTLAYMPVNALFPLMTQGYFGGGAWHVGAVEIAFGVGMLLGSVLLGVWGGGRRQALLLNAALMVMGLLTLLSGLLPPTGWAWFALNTGLLGLAVPFYGGPFTALVQAQIEPAMLGRVFSFAGTMALLATPLGLALTGPVADRLGVPFWFALAGTIILLTGLVSLLLPAVRRLDRV